MGPLPSLLMIKHFRIIYKRERYGHSNLFMLPLDNPEGRATYHQSLEWQYFIIWVSLSFSPPTLYVLSELDGFGFIEYYRTRCVLECPPSPFFYFISSIICILQDYETDTYLRQKWSDPRLSHDDIKAPLDLADPNLVKAIWKPEVFFPNAKEANFQFVTVPNVLIRIHPNGEILYILR